MMFSRQHPTRTAIYSREKREKKKKLDGIMNIDTTRVFSAAICRKGDHTNSAGRAQDCHYSDDETSSLLVHYTQRILLSR